MNRDTPLGVLQHSESIIPIYRGWFSFGKERVGLSRPNSKGRINTQLVHGLNDATEIMAEHLAECFVDPRCFSLTAQALTKLCFNHAECRFDV